MRKTRPDGNCFFRAYGFSLFHSLVVNKDHSEVERLLQVASDVQEDLIEQLGYASSVIDDLMEPFVAVLQEIKEGTVKTSEDVRSVFNNASRSDYIVVFLRLVTSCHLQKNSEFFSAFMEDGITIKDFCKSEVEPMYKESDHIHIIAITETMKLGVRINYLDRGGSATKVNVHDFPEGIANPSIHLLYRPGHYDVLYDQGLEDVPLNSNELVVHNHVLRDNETESSEQLSDDQMPSSSNSTNGVKHGRVVSSTDSSSTSTVPEDNGVSSSKAVKLDPTLTRSSVSSSTSSFVFSNGGSVKAQESNEASTTS
jgi:ubiquitin thioesterase protein OTUB1